MVRSKSGITNIAIFIVLAFILSISEIVRLVTDYWWFDALGFSRIFMISLTAKLLLFAASALFFLIFLLGNLWISSKANPSKSEIPSKLKIVIALILSFFVGLASSQKWFVVLQYLNQETFNLQDPIFREDVAFYVFSLPFIHAVRSFLMACLVLTILLVLLDYMQSFIIRMFKQAQVSTPVGEEGPIYDVSFQSAITGMKRNALAHLAVLGSLFFILLAANHYLARFSIIYSEKGIVVGAGYTDVMIYLPITKILMILALFIALLCYVWIFFLSGKQDPQKSGILTYAVVFYLLVIFIGSTAVPGIVQTYKVSPNEISLESPYLENNIKFTKIAYGLADVEERTFPAEMNLSREVLANSQETMDNIRILDWRPLVQTYKQMQEIRLYYDLSGIDIDRYEIDGKYTEVLLAPREMNQNQIVSKTWVNLHTVYTHGFGVVMSPVNSITSEGLPNYLIKDIPPVYTVNEPKLKIEKPQIYYGERDNEFVLVNTRTEEFDYPKGDSNEYIQYDGRGGVQLDTTMKKLLMAIRFMDIKILLSSDITLNSRIMFERNIKDRISKITPFLMLDRDPYITICNGRLVWIQDAYTVTGNFPYSEKSGSVNYIRNSVKITVDAYDGDVTYYISDTADQDPIITTYARMFPDQFKSFDQMPDELKKHVRYPEDLFQIQSNIYNTYHMSDVKVFYNKEDAWQIPREVYGTSQQVQVDPYYIIMKLPGESNKEFLLMRPFTPIKKNNMIAWLAARSDGDDYGKLLLYKFPKEKLIYGPLQIEAKFDQDSVISEQLTLWSQQGSSVTRGNLLVIPIEDSILYIEPLYILAEAGQLPELKRILVSDGERVVMEKDLDSALDALFGKGGTRTRPVKTGEDGEPWSTEELITEANNYYDAILDSMGTNWTAFGENFERLGDVLDQLREE
ncbi:MAG: UPF0182 family protein [Methanosarcinales archaeon]|nr:MAG: UPF0182 family protein [Methanosarcinales archaeon]